DSTCLGLRKKYCLSLKNDMPPRDKSIETEFPAIVFNDNLTSNETLSCEPTVSSLNNSEINFRISFDESDDKNYTVVFDKNSFSYKIISTNDLKTDSENDNEKVNMPLFPPPEPSVSFIDDLEFFKEFENEFPSIVYNDALTSKSYFSIEPTLDPQHIDEFDLKMKHHCPNMMKWNKAFYMALPPRDQRHQYLRCEGLKYTDADIADFEERLCRIYSREIHRVQVFDFGGLTELMDEGLSGRMQMEHMDVQGQIVFTSKSWRRLFDIRGPLVHELILEFFSTFRFREAVLDLDTTEALYIAGRSQAPEKVTVIDLFYLRGMDVGSVNIPYLLARLQGPTVIMQELPVIDMVKMAVKDTPAVEEGTQADLALMQAPQPPPPPPARTMPQRLGRLKEDM
ncbi:hypothetical protein Tco_0608843, partial [Tanacetum coccineum]